MVAPQLIQKVLSLESCIPHFGQVIGASPVKLCTLIYLYLPFSVAVIVPGAVTV